MRPLNAYNKEFIFNFVLSGRNKNKSSNLVSTLLVASEALRRSVMFNTLTGVWVCAGAAAAFVDPLALF